MRWAESLIMDTQEPFPSAAMFRHMAAAEIHAESPIWGSETAQLAFNNWNGCLKLI